MAGDIEILPFLANQPVFERDDIHLLFRGLRLEEPVAVRSSDRRPAFREPFRRLGKELVPKRDSGRHVGCTEHAGDGDDERPALEGDHPGDVSRVARVPRPRGDVQVFALGVQGGADERQPVLPAIQAARSERPQLMDAQPVTVAGGPNETLLVGGLQLAMAPTRSGRRR